MMVLYGFIGAVTARLVAGTRCAHVLLTGPTALSHPRSPLPHPSVLSKPDLSQKTDILTFKDRKFLILTF